MPLLITDFPPHARPKPKLSRDPGAQFAERERIPQGQATRDVLDECERALVAMLTLLELRPASPQPLSGTHRGVWWVAVVKELGWTMTQFSAALRMLRGAAYVGWYAGHPDGLTRKGIREAILLRKEGVGPWAPRDELGEAIDAYFAGSPVRLASGDSIQITQTITF